MAGKIIRPLQPACLYPGQLRPKEKTFWKATLPESNISIDPLILEVTFGSIVAAAHDRASRGNGGSFLFVANRNIPTQNFVIVIVLRKSQDVLRLPQVFRPRGAVSCRWWVVTQAGWREKSERETLRAPTALASWVAPFPSAAALGRLGKAILEEDAGPVAGQASERPGNLSSVTRRESA